MWTAVATLWIGEAALFHGTITIASKVLAERWSTKPLVARLVADLPAGETVTARGFTNDQTLVPLLYFPDPARFIVVPEGEPLPPAFAPGFYLFTPAAWDAVRRADADAPEAWRVLWTREFPRAHAAARFVFVVRASHPAAGRVIPLHQGQGRLTRRRVAATPAATSARLASCAAVSRQSTTGFTRTASTAKRRTPAPTA